MTLTLRYMKTSDIKQVSAIDHLSFDPPWPTNSYAFEINQSTVSHMVVLEHADDDDNPSDTVPDKPLRRFINQLRGRARTSDIPRTIVGYGGLWKIADEAHISTIAIHPDHRGNGYGEVLLAGMTFKAITLDADYIVLEVRVSNTVAQNLYRKYHFKNFDIKENYYRSDREDAYDMRVIFDDEIIETISSLYNALRQKLPFIDNYSECPHPRRG